MGKGSVRPVSVLESVDKSNNSTTHATTEESAVPDLLTAKPSPENNTALANIRAELNNLLTGCSPLDHKAIHTYLTESSGSDRMMLDAWARCGHSDRKRTVSLRLTETARKTVTPFGLACLITYARAWIDECEAQDANLKAVVRSIVRPPDGERRCRRAGQSKRRRGPTTAKRKS